MRIPIAYVVFLPLFMTAVGCRSSAPDPDMIWEQFWHRRTPLEAMPEDLLRAVRIVAEGEPLHRGVHREYLDLEALPGHIFRAARIVLKGNPEDWCITYLPPAERWNIWQKFPKLMLMDERNGCATYMRYASDDWRPLYVPEGLASLSTYFRTYPVQGDALAESTNLSRFAGQILMVSQTTRSILLSPVEVDLSDETARSMLKKEKDISAFRALVVPPVMEIVGDKFHLRFHEIDATGRVTLHEIRGVLRPYLEFQSYETTELKPEGSYNFVW